RVKDIENKLSVFDDKISNEVSRDLENFYNSLNEAVNNYKAEINTIEANSAELSADTLNKISEEVKNSYENYVKDLEEVYNNSVSLLEDR
ncbi:hypothetical protein, partial [Brachyspira pilosicoli]|uniref:hypothetical protein n=1 Tax=Brachyspira pilosicoli TaxID=52584 RepID=UPI0021551AC8